MPKGQNTPCGFAYFALVGFAARTKYGFAAATMGYSLAFGIENPIRRSLFLMCAHGFFRRFFPFSMAIGIADWNEIRKKHGL